MPDGQTLISVQCIDCKQQKQFSVSTAGYEQWMAGILIQRAMPEIPAGEREILISGQCGACFDAMFAEAEEDEA